MQRGKRLIKTTFSLHTLNVSQKGELVIKVRKENHYQPKQDSLTQWLPVLDVKSLPRRFLLLCSWDNWWLQHTLNTIFSAFLPLPPMGAETGTLAWNTFCSHHFRTKLIHLKQKNMLNWIYNFQNTKKKSKMRSKYLQPLYYFATLFKCLTSGNNIFLFIYVSVSL